MAQEKTIKDMVVALYSFSIELKTRVEQIKFRSKSWFSRQKDSAGIESANEMLRKARRQNRMISRRFFWTVWSFRASKEEKKHAKKILHYAAEISAALKSINLYDPRNNSKYTVILVRLCQDFEGMFGSKDEMRELVDLRREFRNRIDYFLANPYSGRREFLVQNLTDKSFTYPC